MQYPHNDDLVEPSPLENTTLWWFNVHVASMHLHGALALRTLTGQFFIPFLIKLFLKALFRCPFSLGQDRFAPNLISMSSFLSLHIILGVIHRVPGSWQTCLFGQRKLNCKSWKSTCSDKTGISMRKYIPLTPRHLLRSAVPQSSEGWNSIFRLVSFSADMHHCMRKLLVTEFDTNTPTSFLLHNAL